MYKLTVVGGPARGAAYTVNDGETSIGRVDGNTIVLNSQKISKRHCVLVVDNTSVTVRDVGSSNGTFVNGVLTKLKKLIPGDRLSVGEYVFELTKIEARVPANNIVQLQSRPGNVGIPMAQPMAGLPLGQIPATDGGFVAPSAEKLDFKGRAKDFFEKNILNFIYNLNEKHEWNQIISLMIGFLTASTVFISVYLVLDRASEKLSNEAKGRALLLARQVAERNAPLIYDNLESKVDVSFVEKELGVSGVYLIDMDGRIMAPGRLLNQNLSIHHESSFGTTAMKKFRDSEELPRFSNTYDSTVAAAVPVRVFSPSSGKNVVIALALVFYDRSTVMIDSASEALAYIQAMIFAAIVGVLIYFSLYRVTLNPLIYLNESIDKVLKGSASVVTKKFKMEEVDSLVDVINSALQRMGGGTGLNSGGGGSESLSVDDLIEFSKFFGLLMHGEGLMILSAEKKILHINPFLEEVTGIRNDGAMGTDIQSAARDAAFSAFVEDALAKAPVVNALSGISSFNEDFEFSGTNYHIACFGFGSPSNPRAYFFLVTRANG